MRIIQESYTLLKVDCVRFRTLDQNSQFAKNILKDKEITDSIYQNIKNVYVVKLKKTVTMFKNNFLTIN